MDAEPEIPEAAKFELLQEVALVELQVSIDDCPDDIEVGLADRTAVGAAGGGGEGMATVTVALAEADPPPPLQVTE